MRRAVRVNERTGAQRSDRVSPRKPVMRGGIDLGGTKIQAVVVDGKWNVVGQSRRPTPTTGQPEGVATEIPAALKEPAVAPGVDPADLASAGVGSPGDVDGTSG